MYTLITGASGFIGQNYLQYLKRKKQIKNVINLDCLNYSGKFALKKKILEEKGFIFIKGSINNQNLLNKIFEKYRISSIIHFAAHTHVDRSIKSSLSFFQNNVIGTLRLLEKSRELYEKKKFSKFIFISTDEIFGSLSKNKKPIKENDLFNPRNPYAASKASAYHLLQSFCHTYGFPGVIINPSNNYGPFQHPEKLIPKIIKNALINKQIPIYGNGRHIRDWIYVEDTCEAIFRVFKYGKIKTTYNVGGEQQIENLEIAKKICDYINISHKYFNYDCTKLLRFVDDRQGHDIRYNLDISKIKKELKWKPNHTLDQGLKKTIEWYKTLLKK